MERFVREESKDAEEVKKLLVTEVTLLPDEFEEEEYNEFEEEESGLNWLCRDEVVIIAESRIK